MCWLYVQNLEREHIDLRQVKIPFELLNRVFVSAGGSSAGAYVNVRCETTVPHLYAAGDSIGGAGHTTGPEAVVYGYEAGLQAGKAAKEAAQPAEADTAQVERIQNLVEKIRSAEQGNPWRTIEKRLQSIIGVFGKFPLSDNKLDTALSLIQDLKKNTEFIAKDAHELTRCLQVISLIETAEVIFTAAKLRDKNLGPFKRYQDDDHTEYLPLYYPKDGNFPQAEIFGLYYGKDGTIHYHSHITNQK
jgi:succinate dehydrogenase/fumarate reductase flavoprotein subunit